MSPKAACIRLSSTPSLGMCALSYDRPLEGHSQVSPALIPLVAAARDPSLSTAINAFGQRVLLRPCGKFSELMPTCVRSIKVLSAIPNSRWNRGRGQIGTYLSTKCLIYRAVIASEARQSSRKAARCATLDSAKLVIPTGLPRRLRLLAMTSLK